MKVDVAIITTREDEFEAVLQRFSPVVPQIGSSGRTYGVSQLKTQTGKNCTVAIVRCSEGGSDTSQQVTNDIIRDLDPFIILVVGIADGIPDADFTLGEVIISSRIHNFNVGALQSGGLSEFDMRGGIHPGISDITASLFLYKHRLAAWNTRDAIGLERPDMPSLQIPPNIDSAGGRGSSPP